MRVAKVCQVCRRSRNGDKDGERAKNIKRGAEQGRKKVWNVMWIEFENVLRRERTVKEIIECQNKGKLWS